MYAIINFLGKQYKILPNHNIITNKCSNNIGDTIILNKIIILFYNNKIITNPNILLQYYIQAQIIQHIKDQKITILKFKRRKHYKKKIGFRAQYTKLKILTIKKI